MLKAKHYILLLIMNVCVCVCAYAQTDTIRYVHPDGKYNNDGRSWATATNRLQDAINDLRDYLKANNLTSGSVYVAAGTYIPTESTEATGGSMLNTAFKIYGGIHVYGGFNPTNPENDPGDRIMANGKKVKDNWADPSGVGTTDGTEIACQWDLRYKTILTGNHSSSPPTFVFDSIRGRYNVTFPASSFHVVWFGTNGAYETSNDSLKAHYKPLEYPASVNGCVISSGNASSRSTSLREHTAYGGGAYMVGNSELRNCIVERCNATLRGGGVYLDGGGVVEFCFIHSCQSAGVGVVQGYGGGACIEYDGQVGHSHITNCAARCGGGLAICHIPSEYPVDRGISYYSPFSSACVINNNTASAEAGGIYLVEGGTINHATVTANNCISPDVTYYGRRHGRSGGIYIRDCGMIYNSVFWGNRCETNNDIQFASVRQVADTTGHQVFVFHTAFMNHDITDWTGVKKEMVFSLDKSNMPTAGSSSNFPCFFTPTVDPNNWNHTDASSGLHGPGVFMHLPRLVDIPGPRIWHLTSYSALDQKGVQVTDAVQDASEWIRHAHTDYGVVTNPYEPVSTLGALVRKPDPMLYALVLPQGQEGREGCDSLPTLFIDPNRPGTFDSSGQFVPQPHEGNSWDTPIKDMGEAISYFRQYLVDDAGVSHHYRIPDYDSEGNPTGDSTDYPYVQILMKEGTITTAGPGNYLERNIRSAAMRVESHMRLYGGYPSKLTGKDTSERNPHDYVSTITANITGLTGSRGFENNSAHVIAMVNTEYSIIDGFTLADANTHDVYLMNSAHAGGGVLVNNATTKEEERINMVGNQLRNCVITNCTSPRGSAIYVNGEFLKSDGEISYAELMLMNCVIRNNTSDYVTEGSSVTESHGVITANGRAYVHIEHCDIVNNVGFPFKTDSRASDKDEPIYCPHPEHENHSLYRGYIRVDNSLIFCNGDRVLDDRGQLGSVAAVTSVNAEGQDYVFGMHNIFDADLRLHKANMHEPRGFFSDGYTVPITDHFMPDGVVSHYTDDIAGVPADSLSRNNKCIFTRANSSDPNYPTFVNPSRNVGHSTNGDKPLYGGTVSYAPMTTNPCVNAAHPDYYTDVDNYDRTDNCTRTRGGAPDVGALENGDLPEAGAIIYVTPDGAGKRDGSSWDNAIAGNTIYALYGAAPAGTDALDEANGTTRIINTTGDGTATIGENNDSGVTTEDNRYCGGYAMKYIYPVFTDRGTNIARDLTIDKYVGGNNPRIDTTGIDTTSTTTMSAYKYNNGTIPSSYVSNLAPDSKYPYGEMSGVSRYIYRAQGNYSPLKDDNTPMIDESAPSNAAGVVSSGRLILTNERRENYVSGLQYAVEQASLFNKSIHKDSVQVWVGAGKYTDYKGFVMRDSVSVYGGFPTSKYNAPGMEERRALMSAVVVIPKSKENKDLDAEDYETILQISDVNPKSGTGTSAVINPAAIKFTDDSATVKVNILYNVTKLTDHNTVNYYRWKPGTDVSATYMRYPDMLNGSANVFGDRHKINRSGATANNITMGNEVFGGITWTAGQKVVYQYFGSPWKDSSKGNNQSWELVYEDRENNINYKSFKFDGARTVFDAEGKNLGTVPRGMELGGVMNTMSVWQTMKNVPAGTYQLQVDLGAYYANYQDETNTGITFYILDANGDIVAEQPMYRKNNQLVRYTFEFEQPSDGDLTVRIMSTPGTKAVDPATGTFGTNGDDTQANYRRVSMANVILCVLDGSGEYVFDHTEEEDTESKTINSTSISEEYVSGTKKKRALLRKRVLQMPDVTSTVYGHGLGDPAANSRGKYGDALAHYERVIKEGRLSNVKTNGSTVNGRHQDPNYKEYNKVYWDGFTIRHGYLHNMHHVHGGGAGVVMFEGARLVNCIVTDNFVGCRGAKGGGVFVDGCTSTIENCFILNNTLTKGTYNEQSQLQGAGLFLYEGTCYNSLLANNWANGPGGGLALCVGKFYNNTVAYNTSNNNVGGVRICTGSEPALFMANTIVYGNNGLAIDITDGTAAVAPFINCYIQSPSQITKTNFLNAINEHTEGVTDGYFGRKNTFLNKVNPSAANTPFDADVNAGGTYTGGAKPANDFSLRQADGIKCINSGEEDFEGAMYEAVRAYLQRDNAETNPTDAQIKNETFYKNVAGVKLPGNDVVYANRVQDCQVDIGAYEFNAAFAIRPDTVSHPGTAIFYVAFDSPGGDASARSPENAACRQKLQQVLDAAGRYKYALMTAARYSTVAENPVAGSPDKSWTVEVRLEGDNTNATTSGDYYVWYTPTRSTKHNVANYHDNTLDYSFIVPHGIQVKGGYAPGYHHYEDAEGNTVAANAEGAHVVDDRDPLTYRSVFSGKITSETGAEGQTYHVVTFTNDLFTPDEDLFEEGEGEGKHYIQGQLAFMSGLANAEDHRAVVDGLFLEDGMANAPDDDDKIGAAAVVTDFAHVRNCVVQNNEALTYGGGLYLKPMALVSGTIIKKNTADVGGGMYIEPPAGGSVDSIAHVISTTICENTAQTTAGGMWFDNTNARVNSTAIWHNKANDFANVSGSFTRSSSDTDYPFVYCAVESRRLEGQGNVELSPRETEGVRWDRQDPFDAILYYPIEMSSTLSRAGMTYMEWYRTQSKYTTLETTDIAGVSRLTWDKAGIERRFTWGTDTLVIKNNDFIEIGARALNKTFEIKVDEKYVMRRLYVMHTEQLNSEAARALQDNENIDDASNMYKQMGSCILNPFHRLGDAFDYIIAARKKDPAKYRNARFEVFVEQGTFYPYHNAYGKQGEVRNNTFLIPEATTVIGGINSQLPNHNYCQVGYEDKFTNTVIGNGSNVSVTVRRTGVSDVTYTLNYALTDSIRLRDDNHRPMRDYNLNSVIEPWELDRQTILSGNAVSGEDFTHVYHVITVHADSTGTGPQPLKYRTMNAAAAMGTWRSGDTILTNPIAMNNADLFHEECDLSILARVVELDGIQIVGGYANHLDAIDTVGLRTVVTNTYFRGGGIFVDGNWTETFEDVSHRVPNVTDPAKYNLPVLIHNCYFNNNMAGNGGALYSNGGIYLFSSHFTQNYSEGPRTKLDQSFIPWSAGGCIATNAHCDIANTLFDNNEARRGLYPIQADNPEDYIPDADARQGFGGVLSVAQTARLRAVNCHFMRNKAVAYPSVYNFLANNHYSETDSMQFVFNSIFWGNEVFEVDNIGQLPHAEGEAPSQDQIEAFNNKYKASRTGVFHYDGDEWDTYERLYQEYDSLYNYYSTYKANPADIPDTFNVAVTNKLAELRAQGDKMEGLYFCSYRKGYGPTGMRPNAEGYLMTQAEQRAYTDSRELAMRTKLDANNDVIENLDNLFSYVHGNNNVIINRNNTAADGPNFKQPTFVAGIDGYMQNADWLLARMNLTTDQGWGHLKQTVKRDVSYYITIHTGATQFHTPEEALAAAKNYNPDATLENDVRSVQGLPRAHFNAEQPAGKPLYNYYSNTYGAFLSKVSPPLPIANQYYMIYSRNMSDEDVIGDMHRISLNPRMRFNDVYIDMGVYEYQYVQLDIKGTEIDTVWVSTIAKGQNQDGMTWETPITDLQGAIDILMASHNNHDKYVCFLGDEEGSFIPYNVIDNRRAFIITSNTLDPLLPDSALADYNYGVRSLNFLGGYSFDVKDAKRDPLAHPTVIEMPNVGNQSQLNQLFIIEDMTRQLVQATYLGDNTARDSVVIPITFDGITFSNPYAVKDPDSDTGDNLGGAMNMRGGAAIYYRWQRQYEDRGGIYTPDFNHVLHPDSALIDGVKVTLPKLTLSNCIFMDNGERTTDISKRSPAVRIDQGGGSSLIVNSLFHSNAGAPIFAQRRDVVAVDNDLDRAPNDVVIVNSTFALNDGHLTLGSDNSEIHNSLIWLDDLANDTLVQLQLDTIESRNNVWTKGSNKTGIANRVTNNAIWGCFQNGDDTYHNDPLVTENGSVFEGPYFVKPDVDASTSEERRARNFRLNPGVRTMNMADTALYRDRVFFRHYPDTSAATHGLYWRRPNGFKAEHISLLANDLDLAAKPRLFGIGMERGAYECQAVLQRVLYVQPNLPEATAGDGSSWQSPFGQGQLQKALDVAAIYTYLNKNADRETRQAYVFVKGSYDDEHLTNLTARDGVNIYGSLPGSFNDTAWMDSELKMFTNAECQRYVNYVRSLTTGVASPVATPTRINSLHVQGEDPFTTGFVFDGFVITNPGTTLTESPVILDNNLSLVRNCLITNNKVDGAPVVDLQNGLLYNSLLFNDSADAVVEVGPNGLLLNNTIVTASEDVHSIDSTNAVANSIVNNIAYDYGVSDFVCFAPYLAQKNAYTLPAYLVQNGAVNYQLHERSAFINAGLEPLPATFNAAIADGYVNFNLDRDVLGNPRKTGGRIDRGALETWRIEPNTAVELTSLTNTILGETEIRIATDEQRHEAFTTHYGGHVYPHPGSVAYLMDSSAMSMAYADAHDFEGIIFRPAYMLVQSGASFFGNGHEVQLNYLAAEKRFVNQRYSMTSFPYNYSVGNVTSTTYYPAKDSIAQTLQPVPFSTYQYNGAPRSEKDYVFRTDNSTLWTPVDTLNRTATDGYLMDFGATTDTVLRFTAFADVLGGYIYTEDDEDKTIYLTQYDNRIPGTGSELNFTRQEDMGWNMKGLPWLVSDYRTDTVLAEGSFQRQMYIPHVFYQMDGAGNYLTAGDQMYTSRSWDPGSKMSMGNAFFTQTATTKAREAVIFHLPYYARNTKASRPIIRMASRPHRPSHMPANSQMVNDKMVNDKMVNGSDILTVMPDSTADKSVRYNFGRDGIKWHTTDSMVHVWLLDNKHVSRISLLGSAPTEVDIPLGVFVPGEGQTAGDFVFSLPEQEAFADYPYVWFIDYERNRIVNLMEGDYETDILPGTHDRRFAVRIGGFPKTAEDGRRQYIVFANGGNLYIRGLIEGDHIDVYTPAGQTVWTGIANTSEMTLPLFYQSGYVVKVNSRTYKVVNL